jgi:bifunctional UDP-N-acetylglucosamine pyrophosphorylase/glucosamine-1-phosphate N-acetyltransferase
MSLIAIVLAAGQGTRMKSDLPKVLHQAAGRTLLEWSLDPVRELGPSTTLVVVGHGGDRVLAALPAGVTGVVQEPQLGTGHAVVTALEAYGPPREGDRVVVTYADMPLLTAGLLEKVREAAEGTAAAVVTTNLADPRGYGRVLRNASGNFVRIVEDRDATEEERLVTEINAGVYVFDGPLLAQALATLGAEKPANAQGEFYLPDVLPWLTGRGERVVIVTADGSEVMGVNSHDQLAAADALLRRRINRSWQIAGVWMQDPDRVYVDASVTLAPGVRLYPGVHLEGDTEVEAGAVIGPDAYLLDSHVGGGARVWYSVIRRSRIGPEAEVGPFASLRPGTVLETGAKAGTFVEMKNARVGPKAKVPHLAYMGDATVGAGANVGAGTITCNYDGYEKHETVIGEGAFIGSDTMLVAPVTVGDHAVTGAGSVISRDVEPGALAVERTEQKNIPGYAARREKKHRPRTEE